MFWPFNIPAKRREREAQQRREEQARQQRLVDEILAENRRQDLRASLIGAKPKMSRPFSASAAATAPRSSSSTVYDDPLSPLNPLSPVNPANPATWSAPVDEPRHSSSSHCSSSSGHSHSSSDYGSSSHSHSSHDHGCSSSSYDSGSSSSSYDSGSSSSSSDW